MREVIVETIGRSTRTIKVGVDRKERKRRKKSVEKRMVLSFVGIVCSPQIIPQPGSDYESFRSSRCWKTPKKGQPKPKRSWQRHGERQPSRRRNRWGRVRSPMYPSPKTLNELGLCIYPRIGGL